MDTEVLTGATGIPRGGTSDTLGSVQANNGVRPARRSGYLGLWRSVPRELGFLLLSLPIVVAGLATLNSVLWTGVGMFITVVGIFLVVGALYVARGFGTLELVRLRWAGRPEITRPQWTPEKAPVGFWRRLFGPIVNGHYWLYLLHGLIINPIVGIASWTITLVWVSVGLGGLTSWFWMGFIPRQGQDFFLSEVIYRFILRGGQGPLGDVPFDPYVGDLVVQFIAALILLATLPFVCRGLVLAHQGIARGLLGAWRSEALQREVEDLGRSRSAALNAEDQSLRRLERDIHDGPQQRLVRLQMDLASAGRKLDDDPAAAKTLLDEARSQAQEALDELRALSRGFAPPILQDRGLVIALESLVARSPIPMSFDNSLDPELRLAPELERSAYFVAAELLTNIAKHSGANHAWLAVTLRESEPGTRLLELSVTDDGVGGAELVSGHGIAGLRERVLGLRGNLTIASPTGGPTRVGAELPLPAAEVGPAGGPAPILEE